MLPRILFFYSLLIFAVSAHSQDNDLQGHLDACNLNSSAHCFSLGVIYENGLRGIKKDETKAYDFFSKACNLDSKQCDLIGTTYRAFKTKELGRLPYKPEELERTIEFFSKGCDLNNKSSCATLSILYSNYRKVEGGLQDKAKYIDLAHKACKLGSGSSCSHLSSLYRTGRGVPKDNAKAIDLKTKAIDLNTKDCDLGNPYRCSSLGYEYAKGTRYIKQNIAKAKEFFKKACDLEHPNGCRQYKKLVDQTSG